MCKKKITLIFTCVVLASCVPPSKRAQALRDKIGQKPTSYERYKKFQHAHNIDNVDYDVGPYHTQMIRD